ncbi:MAG: c-type cytochrome [Gammaproteobacteria bacterium]|nr:c-type cytochrome [Gammaproteobacteria bacterium]
MSDRNLFKMFTGLVAALVAVTVVIFVVAQMVTSGLNLNAGKTAMAQNQAAIAARIKPVGEVTVGNAPVVNSIIPAANAAVKNPGKATFESTCIACHGAGVAGAPKFGDKAAWAPHIAKGLPTLYQHALHGFSGKAGYMPAKGGNPGLSDADVEAAVRYMVAHGK